MQPNYAPQRATHRRTEIAIIDAAKDLIASGGVTAMSMIDIADQAQVSRATLYNHYRDKNAVLQALISSEIDRLVEITEKASTPADCLEKLSIAISTDKALSGLREYGREELTTLLIHSEDPRYLQLAGAIYKALKSKDGTLIAMRWLLAQALQPLSTEQSRDQAGHLIDRTLF